MKNEDLHQREKPVGMGRGRLEVELPCVVDKISFRGTLNRFGAFSYGNVGVVLYDADVGRYCSIAHEVMVGPTEHPVNWMSSHCFVFNDRGTLGHSSDFLDIVSNNSFAANQSRTTIGNDVWIGYRAFIRRGIVVGDGAIVAANATVVKDVEPYTIVGGTPAKVIRKRFDEVTIKRLQALQWWGYSLGKQVLGAVDYSDVSKSLDVIERAIEEERLKTLEPKCVVFVNGALA
ncbi:CatB-related O-acetyltransferase [Pseudomonas sp. P5_152]|uniref:CatB-related O-acetyltransferase n=1 Tax=Pseudomonas sp. P5_152 TaxID=3043442 RepID=UPI002A35D435|nr:CatB-related O-acetyltransferase [Pseudomonas sp. P5_152]MDX9664212.1 CatB-related O-acetyltransferase [Pseudomonas sp. P5_152]